MKITIIILIGIVQLAQAQKVDKYIREKDITRIIRTLASDEMNGRSSADEKSIFRAAAFIEKEFKLIGLKPLTGTNGFLQEFSKDQIMPDKVEVIIDGEKVALDNVVIGTEKKEVNINDNLAKKSISLDNTVLNKDQYILGLTFDIFIDI